MGTTDQHRIRRRITTTPAHTWIDMVGPATGARSRYFRIDSYNPGQEIISRKNTQISQIQPQSAKRIIDDAIRKYGPNRRELTVGNTPTNRAQLPPDAIGNPLQGKLIIEVPVQTSTIPTDILQYASRRRVTIRDINGKVYNP